MSDASNTDENWDDKPVKNLGGRPSTYSKDLADAILMSMAVDEMSVRHACAHHGIAKGTFLGWVVDDHDELAERYKRARMIRAWGLVDEVIDLADHAEDDWITTEKGEKRFNKEAVARSALKVDARKWFAAKVLRNEFGDKVEHSGSLGLNVGGAVDSLLGKLGRVPAIGKPEGEAP